MKNHNEKTMAAILQIKAIMKENDLTGIALLYAPQEVQLLFAMDAPYCSLMSMGGQVVIPADRSEEGEKKLKETTVMVDMLFNAASDVVRNLHSINESLKQLVKLPPREDGKISSEPPITPSERPNNRV